MRIAVANWTQRKAGGVETYLDSVIPELAKLGHEIGFYSEADAPEQRARIELPAGSTAWCAAEIGKELSLTALKAWRPDIIYCHKLSDPILERELINIAPSIFFAHDHDGTCISGSRTLKFPNIETCHRIFGRQCLLQYFPRRCGGLNPATMLKSYHDQSKRLENMKAYRAILTHSDYMLDKLQKHGLAGYRAYKNGSRSHAITGDENDLVVHDERNRAVTLVFAGRFEYLKGAHLLIDALPEAQKVLGRPVRAILAGDGREREALQQRAARIRNEQIKIEFPGWIEEAALEQLFARCDLLVVPSVWPEPFGLTGVEAGSLGVPVAAFDVGGIGDWLSDGINGFLAPGNPPTSKGLAEAIVKCLRDAGTRAQLRIGALELAKRFSMQNHLPVLLEVISDVTRKCTQRS